MSELKEFIRSENVRNSKSLAEEIRRCTDRRMTALESSLSFALTANETLAKRLSEAKQRARRGLDGISAFAFENFLKDLKKLVRKQHQVVPQIVRRVLEAQQVDSPLKGLESSVEGEHFTGPVPDERNGHYMTTYRQLTKLKGNVVLSVKPRDWYI